jgi:predicted dehydrogenase
MPTKARIAVIGAGWWSTYAHIPALQADPDAKLLAVSDPDTDKLAAAARFFRLERTYADYREMLTTEQPDGVIIVTPHSTHYEIAKYCLEHSIHVMLEKPMTLYAAEARKLVELAQARGKELIIGYSYNFLSLAKKAREIILSGVLGRPQYVNCVMVSRVIELLAGDSVPQGDANSYLVHGPGAVYSQPHLSGGGQGHLQLTHLAGLLFFVTGLRTRQVVAFMNNHGLPLDLVDAMAVEFEGGALGTFGGSGNAFQHKLSLQVHCERGAVNLDLIAGTLTARGVDGPIEGLPVQSQQENQDQRFATSKNLVEVVLGRAANGSPGEIGWRAVELLDAAYRSAGSGGISVKINSLYE